jgi:hypothetical protein
MAPLPDEDARKQLAQLKIEVRRGAAPGREKGRAAARALCLVQSFCHSVGAHGPYLPARSRRPFPSDNEARGMAPPTKRAFGRPWRACGISRHTVMYLDLEPRPSASAAEEIRVFKFLNLGLAFVVLFGRVGPCSIFVVFRFLNLGVGNVGPRPRPRGPAIRPPCFLNFPNGELGNAAARGRVKILISTASAPPRAGRRMAAPPAAAGPRFLNS